MPEIDASSELSEIESLEVAQGATAEVSAMKDLLEAAEGSPSNPMPESRSGFQVVPFLKAALFVLILACGAADAQSNSVNAITKPGDSVNTITDPSNNTDTNTSSSNSSSSESNGTPTFLNSSNPIAITTHDFHGQPCEAQLFQLSER